MQYRYASLIILSLLLASCSITYRSPFPSEHFVGKGHLLLKTHNDEPRIYLSCDASAYDDSRIPPDHKQAAVKNLVYALMASNSYIEFSSKQYAIPDWQRIDRWDSNKGLGFDVYINKQKPLLVIAFRGTESGLKDWWSANAAILLNGQYEEAFKAVKRLKQAFPNHNIKTTGHSLGGALAINASLRIKDVDAIAFNSSPRFFFGKTNKQNHQILLSEKGEILKLARLVWFTNRRIKKLDMKNFNQFNYQRVKGIEKRMKEHSMYRFSRGLLLTAVTDNNPYAKKVFRANFDEEYAKHIDLKCATFYDDINK